MEQIVLGLLCVVGFIVFVLILGALSRPVTPFEPSRPPHRQKATEPRFCIFCNRMLNWTGSEWKMHPNCRNFGQCSECGYELMMSSRADIFTHFCPPRLASERIVVEREMEKQRKTQP